MKPLTRRQQDCLREIETYHEQHGVSPTLKELTALLGYKGKSASRAPALQLVVKLEKAGYITRVAAGKRSGQRSITLRGGKLVRSFDPAQYADQKPIYFETIEAIVNLTNRLGVPPTIREIMAELGISVGAILFRLKKLRECGAISWDDGKYRTLKVIDRAAS